MSTAGSVHSGRFGQYTPDSGFPPATPPRKRVAIFRWRGIFALLFGAAVLTLAWIIFGKIWVRRTIQTTATQTLGAQVDVGGLGLDFVKGEIELRGLAIANPLDLDRNLVEVKTARVRLEPEALFQKKIVIRSLVIDGVRAATKRASRARAVQGGALPKVMASLQQWRKQFNVPLLSLTPVDTIRSLVLNPAQLATVKKAAELETRADSVRSALTNAAQSIRANDVLDSARALLGRLNGQTPRTLGLAGTRNALNDTRRLASRVDSVKRAIEVFQSSARTGIDSLAASLRAVDDARRADYEFARGLLKLPTVDAPNIGPALFGNVSIDAFQQAMMLVSLAREYAPPGLLPRETSGPKRLRRAGNTVHFVRQTVYPNFLLEKGTVALSFGEEARLLHGDYTLSASDVTTEPAIVKRPMRLSLERIAKGSGVESFAARATIDHASAIPREQIEFAAGGLQLPAFPLPGVHLRADLGRGESNVKLRLAGDRLVGSMAIVAPRVAWAPDSGAVSSAMQQLVGRVISSIHDVDLSADLGGTMTSPTVHVRSNLDRAVADGIKGVVGDEVAKAERVVRAQVDSAAERTMAPLRAKVADTRAEMDQRVKEVSTRLDDTRRQLAAQLKSLSGGLLGLP